MARHVLFLDQWINFFPRLYFFNFFKGYCRDYPSRTHIVRSRIMDRSLMSISCRPSE